jgi:hypothetical protein
MPEIGHLRELAGRCLDIARALSDAKAAEGMRRRAAEYSAQAEELENAGEATPDNRGQRDVG